MGKNVHAAIWRDGACIPRLHPGYNRSIVLFYLNYNYNIYLYFLHLFLFAFTFIFICLYLLLFILLYGKRRGSEQLMDPQLGAALLL